MQSITKYSNGQRVISSACDMSVGMLNHTQEKLQLASNELLRMEYEGGIPLTKKQAAKVSAYANASRRIKKLLLITEGRAPRTQP